MPRFSRSSLYQLETCHHLLQKVLREAIKHVDFTVLEGHRGEVAQNEAYSKGLSQVRWPNGKHNKSPSLAVDIAPYPVSWSETPENLERFAYLAGVVMGIASQMGIALRWGGDWNQNDDMRDESFRDRPHIELVL